MKRQILKIAILLSAGIMITSCDKDIEAGGVKPDDNQNVVPGNDEKPEDKKTAKDKPVDGNDDNKDPNDNVDNGNNGDKPNPAPQPPPKPDPNGPLFKLRQVQFANAPDKDLGTKKTDSVIFDPKTNTNKFRYLKKLEKSYKIDPLTIVDQTARDMIYPGAVIHGEDFIKAKYRPVLLKTEFAPMTLSTTLMGKGLNPIANVLPKLSEFRKTKNEMIAKQMGNIDFKFVPNIFHFNSDLVIDTESLKKAVNVHTDINVMKNLFGVNFGYEWENKKETKRKYVMVSLRQVFYSFTVDPKHWSKWFKGEVDTDSFGEYEPLYISNVDYGRIAYLLIESAEDVKTIKHMVEFAVKAAVPEAVAGVDIGADVGFDFEHKMEELFKTDKIRVMCFGGPVELGSKIDNYTSFKQFVQLPSVQDLTKSAVPVSHKVCRLKDNSEVAVFDRFTTISEQFMSENDYKDIEERRKDKEKRDAAKKRKGRRKKKKDDKIDDNKKDNKKDDKKDDKKDKD